MTRRLMALLVAVVLVVGLTSCTPPPQKQTPGAKEPAKTPPKVVEPAPVKPPVPAPPKVVEPAPVKPPVPAPAAGLPEGKVVTDRKGAIGVRATDQPIKLDAKLAEPVWKTAPALVGFLNPNGKPAKIASRVLLTYDKDNLYVAVICTEPNTDKLKTGSKDIWDDDSLELYINTGDTDYFAFHVGPKNARWDRRANVTWVCHSLQDPRRGRQGWDQAQLHGGPQSLWRQGSGGIHRRGHPRGSQGHH